jgi:hypothetical protein
MERDEFALTQESADDARDIAADGRDRRRRGRGRIAALIVWLV